MEPKVNYLLVGIFVILVGAVGVAIVLWLGKADYRAVYDRYYAFTRESVNGLRVNSAVKYRGVDVGSVVEIALGPENPEEVRLTLDIKRGTPIKEDTVAVLRVQGLTGFAIVDLTGGTRASSPLRTKAGEPYPVIQTAPSLLVRLEETGSRLLANLNLAAQNVGGVTDEKNRAALNQILENLVNLTRALAQQRERMVQGINGAAESAESLSGLTKKLNDQLPPLFSRFEKAAGALQQASDEVAKAGSNVNRVVSETRPDIEQFGRETLAETTSLIAELRQLTGKLQQVAQRLEEEPNSLVFGRSPGPRGPGE